MKGYNQELIRKGAEDGETKFILQRNTEVISLIKQFIPYENYNMFKEMLENYEKLIDKYSRYAYLLGFARAIYEKE